MYHSYEMKLKKNWKFICVYAIEKRRLCVILLDINPSVDVLDLGAVLHCLDAIGTYIHTFLRTYKIIFISLSVNTL